MLPLPRFSLEQPDDLADVVALIAAGGRPLAGGTDLLPSMKHHIFEPTMLVSLRRVAALRTITDEDDGVRIGAGVTLRELQRHARIAAGWPALAAAAGTVGTPTLQAMGTLGGNVALDTRCVFYNQPAGWRAAIGGCLKADGTVCHVAPRGSGCYAAHSADTIPALWLYDAAIVIVSADGEREVPVRDLATDDGRVPGLRPGELITAVRLPKPRPVVHRKLRIRAAIDYGLLLVAVTRDEHGLRAVISATGPRPVEVTGGSPADLADAAYAAVQPLGTHLAAVPWRKKMVRVEVRRAAEALLACRDSA